MVEVHFKPQRKQEEDTKETAQFEHDDSEQAAVAEQDQETAEKVLYRGMATLQEYCPARRSQRAICTSRRPFTELLKKLLSDVRSQKQSHMTVEENQVHAFDVMEEDLTNAIVSLR